MTELETMETEAKAKELADHLTLDELQIYIKVLRNARSRLHAFKEAKQKLSELKGFCDLWDFNLRNGEIYLKAKGDDVNDTDD